AARDRRLVRLHGAFGRGRSAEDVRGVPGSAAVPQQADPGAVERRIGLDPTRGLRGRGRYRERHELPGTGGDPALPGGVQRDGDPLSVRGDVLREQTGTAGGEPLPDDRGGGGTAEGAGADGALGRGAGDRVRSRV
ncbi:MAG: FIG00460691: hypothetical protein, partial [uncultured Thermomicrobiales bacterium]